VEGSLTQFQYDRNWHTARVHVSTPPIPHQPIALNEVSVWVEKPGQLGGELLSSPARPLEQLGAIPYGYVKYFSQFSYSGQPKMFISTFADDDKVVFLNGKRVAEASNPKMQADFALSNYAHTGINGLEIVYELFGSPNFGPNLGELKGIESVRVGSDAQNSIAIDPWQIQRFPAARGGRGIDPEFALGGWKTATVMQAAASGGRAKPRLEDFIPAFTWCRAEFALLKPSGSWSVAWKVRFEADRDALLYLNGKFVGRYVTIGPQTDFYLPEPYLAFDGKRKNVLTLVLAYTDDPRHIRTMRIEPYLEFATRRTRIEFDW
jgi:hypothetical protein